MRIAASTLYSCPPTLTTTRTTRRVQRPLAALPSACFVIVTRTNSLSTDYVYESLHIYERYLHNWVISGRATPNEVLLPILRRYVQSSSMDYDVHVAFK